MQTVLIVIHLFVALALTIVVLLQKSEGGALGMGGSGGGLGGFFSPRGAANTLTRTTAILGLIFFLSSLALTWLAINGGQSGSILAPTQGSRPAPTAPGPAPAPGQAIPARTTAPAATTPAAPAPSAPAPAAPAPAAPAPAP